MRDPRLVTGFARQAIAVAAVGALLAGCSSAGSGSPAATASAATASAASPASAGATTSASASGSGSATTVAATESEFKIDLDSTKAAPGSVTFHIKNGGSALHEFVVMRTDLSADKLPLASSAPEVDEDSEDLTAVDEVEDIAAGATADLTVDLPAGHYVVICNVPGHYSSGMHTDFTVGT
jgi:uncharacterized cupredoxin-like copper-binding protein